MAGLVPATPIRRAQCQPKRDRRDIRAFTPVIDGLWPGMTQKRLLKIIPPAAPAVLPHLLTDGAGDARLLRRGRDHARLRLPAGDELFAPASGGSRTAGGATQVLAALAPGRPEKLLLGRRYWS